MSETQLVGTELEIVGKTETGNLDFPIAALLCYVPVSFVHVIAAVVFLSSEPREHRFVRFHAVQSLMVAALMFGGAIGSLVLGMMVLPLAIGILGSLIAVVVSAVSEDLGAAAMLLGWGLGMLCYFAGAALSILFSLGLMPAMLITGALAASGKQAKWPVLGNLAMRFV